MKTFMGQTTNTKVQEKKDKEGNVLSSVTVHRIGKKDHEAILDDLGVTKEVRKLYADAENQIAGEAYKSLDTDVKASKSDHKLIVGSSSNGTEFGVKAKCEVTNNKTGETKTVYGRASMRIRRTIPKVLRDGIIDEMRKGVEMVMK